MAEAPQAGDEPIVHGFPHLETVRAALTALYKRLSADGVERFATSVRPELVDFPDDEELYLGAQRVARVMVQHFRLPDARMVVSFRDMVHAGNVELAAARSTSSSCTRASSPTAAMWGRRWRTR